MPVTIRQLPPAGKLASQLTMDLFAATIPAATIDQVLQQTQPTEQRHRLTMRAMVWLIIAMNLWRQGAIPTVYRQLTRGLRWVWPDPPPPVPTSGAFTYRRYRLGAGLSRLARIREAHFPFTRLAVPIVRELAQETGETVHISEFSAGALLTAHVELSAKANRVNVDVGQVLPLHGTASGIAFLAASSDEAVKAYVEKPLQAFTQHTVTARAKVLEAIRLAAARGYSRSLQGYEEGVHSIGAAILGADGQPIGTLSIASPVSRIDDHLAASQGEAATRAARLISARLTGEA